MWENDSDNHQTGREYVGENMHNSWTGQRECNGSRRNTKTPQQHGNNHKYTATRTASQFSTPDSRNVSNNIPLFGRNELTGVSTSKQMFIAPPLGNTRMPFNLPPPGYNTTNMPPPGFNTTNMPPPGFNTVTVPPPGFNKRDVPPPGYVDQRLPPPEYTNNLVPRAGVGPALGDNRLFGGMFPPDGIQPVGVLPPDRGVQWAASMDVNSQHNMSIPPMVHSQGLSSPLQTFPSNHITIANQQTGLQHNSKLVATENEQTVTRITDQSWVNSYMKERNIEVKKTAQKPQVSEAKQMLTKWLHLINEMEAQRDNLSEKVTAGSSEWQRELQKLNMQKETVLQIESEFTSQYDLDSLLQEIKKKKKKREWKKRQKKNLALKKKEMETRKFELHLQIDQWREKEIAKDQAKIKAASMKKEAGGVLGDVRRKQAESSKAVSLLEALQKLRSFRKQEAELKGVYPKPSPDQNREFNERLEVMERIMKKHLELYESEEKTLEVMLAEEEEEKEKERREKQHTKQLAEAAASDSSDPMREFYHFYTQAENGLDSLLHIRHGWDVYIVPQSVPGASFLPPRAVTPTAPSTKAWAVHLKDNG